MDSLLLVRPDTGNASSGSARLINQSETTTWDYTDYSELSSKCHGQNEMIVLVDCRDPDSSEITMLATQFYDSSTSIWYTSDLEYLFQLEHPDDLDGMTKFASEVIEGLAGLDQDLLNQICLLTREQAAEIRLSCFVHELYRRFDPLNVPAAGQLDAANYMPDQRISNAPARQEVQPDILEQVLSARRSMAEAFEQYEERPQQIAMAQAVESSLEESRPLIIEAGTGVGKSLAYLLPLAIYSARTGNLCLVSTNTLNLQQQLINQDVPRLEQILDVLELKITLLKGREHYLCVKRLQDTWLSASPAQRRRFTKEKPLSFNSLLFLVRLLIQLYIGGGDLDDVPGPAQISQRNRQLICGSVDCNFHTCLGERCQYVRRCHFFRQRAEAQTSNIVITNHALVFSLFNPAADDADNIVTRSSAIVFDEAHNLENVITNQNTLEVTHHLPVDLGNSLLELLQYEGCRRRLELDPTAVQGDQGERLRRIQTGAAEVPNWIKISVEVRDQINRLLDQAADKGHVSFKDSNQLTPTTSTPGQYQVMELLGKLAERLNVVMERMRQLTAELFAAFCSEESDLFIDDDMFQMDCQSLNLQMLECTLALSNWRPQDPDAITWFNCNLTRSDPDWEYKAAPLKVGSIFQSLVSRKETVVLCSATLTVAGSFDYLQESLGFEPEHVGFCNWMVLDSPFDYQQQSLLLLASDLQSPTGSTRDNYLAQLEEVVTGVSGIFDRGILVLFNSYRDLNHIAERLALQVDPERILVQGVTATRAELSERFRTEGDKILLATRSFWEGFDVAGESLSCVVLAKLPFANFKDPIHAGRQRAIDADGGDSFKRYSLPLAVMQLKQGFGRLIRTSQDRGCVFLLDSRAGRASYGKVFLESLPNPRIYIGGYADCLESAGRFMSGEQEG